MQTGTSAIFLTTASGLGYGMLILLGIMAPLGLIAADRNFAIAAFGLAFAAVTLGLFAASRHVGQMPTAINPAPPSSPTWETIAAVATYVPTGVLAYGWAIQQDTGGIYAAAGVIGAISAFIAVACTGKLYAGLRAVAAWSNRWTIPGFVVLALATGSLWLAALARLFGVAQPWITHLPVALILLAWIVKVAYWWSIDTPPESGTRDRAMGQDDEGVAKRFLPAAHTEENFVMREPGHGIVHRHSARLRRTAQGLAFALPLMLTELDMFVPNAPDNLHTALAAVSACLATAGVALERWLFFAEATYVVALESESEDT